MRYAVFAGGQARTAGVWSFSLSGHESRSRASPGCCRGAAALEMLHTFSLVHDDLPALDDDDLRRGRPTVHRTVR